MGGTVVWFTGLPASGKTSLAELVRDQLAPRTRCVLLDSDTLHEVLGEHAYSELDRTRFYDKLARLAALLANQGHIVLVAATAPQAAHRAYARTEAPSFIEVHVRTPLALCEARDPKGLYARARTGGAPTLPGIGVPYEPPTDPEVIAENGHDLLAVDRIVRLVTARPRMFASGG